MNSLLLVIIAAIILMSISTQVNASSHHITKRCNPPYSVLYVFTFPESKECVLLTHAGKAVDAKTGAPFK
jgi:hypothetical protein